jgi:hypothetical protein
MAENMKTRSKFDRSHGKGLKAPHMGFKGATAPITGTVVPGHNDGGHMIPMEQKVKLNKNQGHG